MTTRRDVLGLGPAVLGGAALAGAVISGGGAARAATAELGDDGLYKAPWLRETFKDLREDAEEARAEGKRLLVMVEQRGCIYCKKMHEEVLVDPRIEKLLTEAFFPVQINLHGDTEMVDTDGTELTEKEAARRWGILFTPTMIFLPPEIDPTRSAIEQAVAVMPGAFGRETTYNLLTWVLEERYLDPEEDFQRYHARKLMERGNGGAPSE